MKTKKPKKKILTLIITGLILISIFFVSGYFHWHQQQNKPFTMNSLNLSDWVKNEQSTWFWFPRNDITIVKYIKDSYSMDYNISFESPLKQENIDVVINYQPIFKIREELEKQKFTELSDLSGLFANDKDSSGPYYIRTYQKGSIICQLNFIFECFNQRCQLNSPRLGCASFNLESEYQEQQKYYQLKTYYSKYYKDHKTAIVSVMKNSKDFLVLNAGYWTDGAPFFFDQNNQQVCDGKPCCDSTWEPNTMGDWCTNDYQTIDTYKPVGL